jgi:hypothetical protein
MMHSWHEGTVGRYIKIKDGNTSTARDQPPEVSDLPSEENEPVLIKFTATEQIYKHHRPSVRPLFCFVKQCKFPYCIINM